MIRPLQLDPKRIQALKDATFAVALTIVILEIDVDTGLSHEQLEHHIINEIFPSLFIYLLSFISIGAFWIDSHYHHNYILKTDRRCSWLNILFLMFICTIPFSTELLIGYRLDNLSAAFYGSNLLCVNLCHLSMLVYAWNKGYFHPEITPRLYRIIKKRLLVPILLYAVLIPLALFSQSWINYFFLIPLSFQIFFGRSKKETEDESQPD